MATFAATMAGLAALLILPLVVLLWATESSQQRARRWRAAGQSCKAIGARLGVTHQQVSVWCRA